MDVSRPLAVGVALVAVLAWQPLSSPFGPLKTAALLVLALLLVALVSLGAVRTRRLVVPRSWVSIAVAAFVAGLVVAVAAAPSPAASFFGRFGRQIGAATYLACAVLWFAASQDRDHRRSWVQLARWIAGAAAVVAGYALLQVVDADPWTFGRDDDEIVSLLGNPNFVAAFLAVTLPLAAWRALRPGPGWERWVMAAIVVASVGAIVAAGSSQGPIAAVAGLLPIVVLGVRPDRRAQTVIAAGAVVLVAGLALLAGIGPLSGMNDDIGESLDTRRANWAVAGRMFQERPLTGYGFGEYVDYYRTFRPADEARRERLERAAEDAHSVPLDLAAAGGILLVASYLAFVVGTGAALVVGLRRLDGDARVALAAIGGTWLAYQVQSLVSLDVAPLAALHWVAAGTIAAAVHQPLELRLGRAAATGARRAEPRAAVAAVLVVTAVLAWFALIPLRATAAEGRADGRDLGRSLAALSDAADLMPWEARFPEMTGKLLLRARREAAAEDAFRTAMQRDDRSFSAVINLARLAARRGDALTTQRTYQRALELDPNSNELGLEAGSWLLEHERAEAALPFLEQARAHGLRKHRSETLFLLGRARMKTGDTRGARRAWDAIPTGDRWRERADKAAGTEG